MGKSIWWTLLIYEYVLLLLYSFIISYDKRLGIETVFFSPIPYLKKVTLDIKKVFFAGTLAAYSLFGCLLIEGIFGLFFISTEGEWWGWIIVKLCLLTIPTIFLLRSFYRKKCFACDGTKRLDKRGVLRPFLKKDCKCFVCYSAGNYRPQSPNGKLSTVFNDCAEKFQYYTIKSKNIHAAIAGLPTTRSQALLNKLEVSEKQVELLLNYHTDNLAMLVMQYKELRIAQESLKNAPTKEVKEQKKRISLLKNKLLKHNKNTHS